MGIDADGLRIALVAPDCHKRDGQARYVSELAERLSARHRVEVYAGRFEDTDPKRVQHRPVDTPRRATRLRFFAFLAAATRALRRDPPDLVHALGASCLGPDVSTVQFCQAAWQHRLREQPAEIAGSRLTAVLRWCIARVEARVLRSPRVQQVITVSRRVSDEVGRHYGRRHNVTVIPNGVDTQRFHPELRRHLKAVRGEYGIPETAFLVLFVGEFERKSLATVIRALPTLPQAWLLAVGSSSHAPYRKLAEELGVTDRVQLAPPTSEPELLMAAADAFAFPSLYEPFGMAPLEAAACGTPVLVSDRAGFAEHLEDGVNGLVLRDPTDPQELALQLGRLAADPERSRTLGQAGRRLAEGFHWDRIVASTEAVYQQVLADRRR